MNYFKNNSGFLLIELLIGMTITVIILSAVVPLFARTLNVASSGMANNDLLQEARWAVDFMARDISYGNSIITPSGTTQTSSLIFQRFDTLPNITYSVVNNEICRQVGNGTQYPITNGARASVDTNGLLFAKDLIGDNVTIALTLVKTDNKNVTHRQTASVTVHLMNTDAGIGGN